MAAGLTSDQMVKLRNQLETILDLHIPVSVPFTNPTVASMVSHLGILLSDARSACNASPMHLSAHDNSDPDVDNEDSNNGLPEVPFKTHIALCQPTVRPRISLLSAACMGSGPGLSAGAEFWMSLFSGSDSLQLPPASHCQGGTLSQRHSEMRPGHFILEPELFDHEYFGMHPVEVAATDPNQRVLLQVCVAAFVSGGYSRNVLSGNSIAVFLGLGLTVWSEVSQTAEKSVYSQHGRLPCAAAGRISYTLDLKGPCLAIDTACSSSLVALNMAATSMQLADCQVALGAGVSMFPHVSAWTVSAWADALAPDGKCKTFDSAADGYGRGRLEYAH